MIRAVIVGAAVAPVAFHIIVPALCWLIQGG